MNDNDKDVLRTAGIFFFALLIGAGLGIGIIHFDEYYPPVCNFLDTCQPTPTASVDTSTSYTELTEGSTTWACPIDGGSCQIVGMPEVITPAQQSQGEILATSTEMKWSCPVSDFVSGLEPATVTVRNQSGLVLPANCTPQ